MPELKDKIETKLAELDPEVELVALERPGADVLRLFIDSPEGVDLALCERVTHQLGDLLEHYSLEVSSPGLDRPLTKPEHFRRFLGRRARIRTRQAIDGQRSFTGTLTAADETRVRVEAAEGMIEIPLSDIGRSNLVPELPEVLK